LIGQITLSQENSHAIMTSLARNALHVHRLETMEELCEEIHAVSAGSLQSLAAEVFRPDQMSMLAFTNEP
jgi:predicted Zn-dependent peptidase